MRKEKISTNSIWCDTFMPTQRPSSYDKYSSRIYGRCFQNCWLLNAWCSCRCCCFIPLIENCWIFFLQKICGSMRWFQRKQANSAHILTFMFPRKIPTKKQLWVSHFTLTIKWIWIIFSCGVSVTHCYNILLMLLKEESRN